MGVAVSSTEYVHVNVSAWIPGGAISLASPPKFAFLPVASSGNPVSGDWLTGEWQGGWARIMVGPNGGAVTLGPGKYSVWISFAAGSESPVRRTGLLEFI